MQYEQDFPALGDGSDKNQPGRLAKNQLSRILVVDDDRDVCLIHNRALLHGGYRTDTAEDGAMAWSLLQCNRYDLLITDNEMPKVSGVELLLKLNAARMKLPVIMITGGFPHFDFSTCPWLPAPITLLKPVSYEELMGTVEIVLGARVAAHKANPTPPA